MKMTKTLFAGGVIKLDTAMRSHLSSSLALDPTQLEGYLTPQAEDYVRIPVRALSAAEVQHNYINFAHNGGDALKQAVAMFEGLTILKDHNMSVENWIGKTEVPYWSEGDSATPPGVNLMMKLDTKADPKTVRGLVSGDLNSVSVTIEFDYEQSHPKMDEFDFYMKLGTIVDGKTVQALVTKVTRLYELSVVWQGADKFAKTIGTDGSISVPGVASNSLQLSKEATVDLKKFALMLGLALGDTPTEETITAALVAERATAANNVTLLTAAQTQGTALTTEVAKLTADVAAKVTEIATLTTKNTELTAQAALGDKFLKDQRAEALRLYNLCEGDKATEAMRNLINGSSLEVAQSFVTSYAARAESLAPVACTKCGSLEVTRRKSASSETNDLDKKADKLSSERLKSVTSSIHG